MGDGNIKADTLGTKGERGNFVTLAHQLVSIYYILTHIHLYGRGTNRVAIVSVQNMSSKGQHPKTGMSYIVSYPDPTRPLAAI